MPTGIALIRGINVGGRNSLPMATLRELCETVGLKSPVTYLQSGNVVFHADPRTMSKAAPALENAIESKCKFRPSVITRTVQEVQAASDANPLASIRNADPSRLMIMFLADKPSPAAARALAALDGKSERVGLVQREAYLYFPQGVANSKLTMAAVERALARLDIPRDMAARISRIVLPGSSLIISDEPPHLETGKDTDFVVIMSGEPQGGIAIRERAKPERSDDDDDNYYWGGGNNRRNKPYGGGGGFFWFN